MNKLDINPSLPGAVYRRVSTDKQDAKRQESSTQGWLNDHHLTVPNGCIFEDLGWSRADAAKRPRFQAMLRAVQMGQIRWIIVDRPDRFGAKDKFEAFHYLHLLREANCKLYTVDDRELTSGDTASALITHLDYDQSERELREKSIRTLSGKVEFAKRSEWLGGRIPYAMDVVSFRVVAEDELLEQWRVSIVKRDLKIKLDSSGERREYTGTRNFPASEQDEILQLRPTLDQKRLKVVRLIYHTFLSQATTPGTIARQLLESGIEPPPYSTHWQRHHVTEILTNPCYMGRPAWNRKTVGDYSEWSGGRRVEKQPGTQKRYHGREDWVMPGKPIFVPVVSSQLWEKANQKMLAMPKHPRSSRPQSYTYSTLIMCGDCGAKMSGQAMNSGRKTKRMILTYLCGTYNNWRGKSVSESSCQCKARRISQSMLDDYVKSYFSDTLPHVTDMSESLKNHKPFDLTAALKRTVMAHKKMRERIGAEFVSVPASDKPITLLDLPFHAFDRKLVSARETDDLERMYRWHFNNDKNDLETRKDELQTKQDDLIETIKKIPATAVRAVAKVQRELDEVETELSVVEDNLLNAADVWKVAESEWRQLQENWDRATSSLQDDGAARQRAEALRAVIEKIVVRFRPTGKKKPAFEVDSIQIIPKDANDCAGSGTSLPTIGNRS